MFTITLSDEEITKIKVVDLNELYIFGIHHFFSWNHLVFQNLVRTCYFLNLKIWMAQALSNKKNDQIYTVTWYGMILENFRKKIITFEVSMREKDWLEVLARD